MKSVTAVDDAGPRCCGTCKFQRRLDCLGSRVCEENLLQIGDVTEQAFGQQPRQSGHVHLDQIRKFSIEHLFQGIAHEPVIAPKSEYAPSTQKIEVSSALAIEEILAGAAHVSTVEPEGLEHPDHLLVEIAGMQRISFSLPLGEEFGDVEAH